jgi:hypothetical protein
VWRSRVKNQGYGCADRDTTVVVDSGVAAFGWAVVSPFGSHQPRYTGAEGLGVRDRSSSAVDNNDGQPFYGVAVHTHGRVAQVRVYA